VDLVQQESRDYRFFQAHINSFDNFCMGFTYLLYKLSLGIYLAKATGVCVWQHYIYLVIGLSPALTNQRLLGVESLPAMTARVGFGFT